MVRFREAALGWGSEREGGSQAGVSRRGRLGAAGNRPLSRFRSHFVRFQGFAARKSFVSPETPYSRSSRILGIPPRRVSRSNEGMTQKRQCHAAKADRI